jgi:hypothetical protein
MKFLLSLNGRIVLDSSSIFWYKSIVEPYIMKARILKLVKQWYSFISAVLSAISKSFIVNRCPFVNFTALLFFPYSLGWWLSRYLWCQPLLTYRKSVLYNAPLIKNRGFNNPSFITFLLCSNEIFSKNHHNTFLHATF